MDIAKAKEILQLLADGVDPTTGELLPNDSPYNKPEVVRAIFAILAEATSKQQSPKNAGKPWDKTEDDKLRSELAAKMHPTTIAKEHGRSRGAINSRIKQLDLKK